MAVDYASSSVVAEGSRASTVFTAPTGITNGDLLLIWCFAFNGSVQPVLTPPAGFAAVFGTWPLVSADTTSVCYLWSKIASSESGDYTVSQASTDVTRGIVVRVSGNDTSTPMPDHPTQGVGTGSTTTFTGLTSTVDSELILVFAEDNNDAGGNLTPPTGTTPTFTERVDDNHGNYLATGILAAHGATGNNTMGNNSTSGSWFSAMVAVQPTAVIASQTVLPDADLATTGWTTTPLFSKVNDASDGTVITATLA